MSIVLEEKIKLRQYQKNAFADLCKYIKENKGKNPCLCMPTGSGKSLVIAKIVHTFREHNPQGNIIILTHVKELIKQNHEKIIDRNSEVYTPAKDVGIFCAGLEKEASEKGINGIKMNAKDLDKHITIASIHSIYKYALKKYKMIIIDEAHRINSEDIGRYRDFIRDCKKLNPNLVVVGLTATPYRTKGGLLTSGAEALFDDILSPKGTSIKELVLNNHLAPLKSKGSELDFDFSKVKIIAGDYVESEIQKIMNTHENNRDISVDLLGRIGDKKHILIFCTGIEHSEDIAFALEQLGVKASFVHGKLSAEERNNRLRDFKNGKIQFLANVNVLTTGFDFPDIDCLVMMRPTLSTSLYMQMAGRGMRLKKHIGNCLVLDYVGNIERHGPVTSVNINIESATSERKARKCKNCQEYNDISEENCSDCGEKLSRELPNFALRDDDIMGGLKGKALEKAIKEMQKYAEKIKVKLSLGLQLSQEEIEFIINKSYVKRHNKLRISLIKSNMYLTNEQILNLINRNNKNINIALLETNRLSEEQIYCLLYKYDDEVSLSLIASNNQLSDEQIDFLLKQNNKNIDLALIQSFQILFDDQIDELISKKDNHLHIAFINSVRQLSDSQTKQIIIIGSDATRLALIESQKELSSEQILILINKISKNLYQNLLQSNHSLTVEQKDFLNKNKQRERIRVLV